MTSNQGTDGSADTGDSEGAANEGGDGHSNDQGQNDQGEQVRDPEAVLRNNEKLTNELKAARAKIAKSEADAEERRVAAMSEHEKAIEKARKDAVKETRAEMQTDIVRERIRAKATGVLADPDDAVTFIDATTIDFDDSSEQIEAALAELIEAKPHLAGKQVKRQGINQGPQGDAPSGQSANDWIRRAVGRG